MSKSDYLHQVKNYDSVINYFDVLVQSGMLNDFCSRNNLSLLETKYVVDSFKNLETLVDEHNEKYVSEKLIAEKEYLDNILKSIDPTILLDEDQRRVVLADEDYCLVIAGAGAGKTTTVAAKVKYLVDKKKKPSTFCNADGKKCRSGGIRPRGLLVPKRLSVSDAQLVHS